MDATPAADTVCGRFNELELHDSRFLGMTIVKREEPPGHDISIDLAVLRGSYPQFSWEPAQLVFTDSTYVRLDFDLDGKSNCGDAISTSKCVERSELRDALEKGPMRYEQNPLAGYVHFSIFLIPPGGELHVFASDFMLKWVQSS